MSEPNRRFFSGDTLQQALVQAASHYHLDPSEIAYSELEKRHGFLKTRRKVMIEVDPAAPRRPPGAPRVPPPPPVVTAAGPELPALPALPAIIAATPDPAPTRPDLPPREPSPAQPLEGRPRGGERGRDRDRRSGPGPSRDNRDDRGNRDNRGNRDTRDDRGNRGNRDDRGNRVQRAQQGERVHDAGRPGPAPVLEGLPRDVEDDEIVVLPEKPRPTSARFAEATGPLAEAARKGLELILGIAGLNLSARVYQGEERLEIDLSGEDAERCFDDEGELLRAIEHLLPRVLRAIEGEAIPCRVDCDSFHEIREEQLRTLAQRMAEDVRRRGSARMLEPMNPADRRIVHMTLADDPGVETESDGEGYFKRITIRPR